MHLRVRDVQQASLKIAKKHKNDEYAILINRLSEIENKSSVPSVCKLYSLCVIYRLDFQELLEWFGISLNSIPLDAREVEVATTHPVAFQPNRDAMLPLSMDPFDLRRTTYLSRMIRRWGKLPLSMLDGLNLKEHRYAYIGTEDWFMHPLLPPGSFVIIDESKQKIADSGWHSEFERPIYFLEHRQGYRCSWCSLQGDQLILQPHGASSCSPEVYKYPGDIAVIGQVISVALHLNQRRRSRKGA